MNAAQRMAAEQLQALVLVSRDIWPDIDLSDVRMTFDLRGTSAGMAYWFSGKIRLNNGLLVAHTLDEMLNQTLPHELAHIIAGRMEGRKMGHGPRWRNIMRNLGLNPDRCHGMEVEHLKTRRERSYPATCGCGDRTLSIRRGNRMRRTGCTYRCGKCKTTITVIGAAV